MERGILQRHLLRGFAFFYLSSLLMLSACGSVSPTGQQAQQAKAALDAELAQAQRIGVPQSMLTPIQQQENRVAQGATQTGLFGDNTPDSAYKNATLSYQVLLAETLNVEIQATQLAQGKTETDIGNFADALQLRQHEQCAQVPNFQARLTQA